MVSDQAWGFALVICEEQHAAFPMTFEEPMIPQHVLSDFNRGVQSFCRSTGIAYSHDTAVKCATMMLLNGVLPVAEGAPHDTDWRQLTASLMFVANITCLKYFTVRATNSDLIVEKLAGDSLDEAQCNGKALLDTIEQQIGHTLALYVVVDNDVGIDIGC